MLRATRRELTKAYRRYKPYCADLSVTPYKLLALYRIECGLKALIMQQKRVESTNELPFDAEIGHDLMAGLRLLNAPATLFTMKTLRISTLHDRDPQQIVAPGNLHQALRYGIPTNLQVEISAEIEKITEWLEGKFNEAN
jgi:hypothetical protein